MTVDTSYDALPYQGNAVRYSHPGTLATVGALAGLRPAPVDRCRVLELGCAEGGNLLPMADALPGSTFLGVDLSARQIETGQAVVRAAGLSNVELRCASITDITDGWGTFDYILCHGVYSWVPPTVADKILDVCSRNLAPDGLAYVSYNTYPGWHLRGIVREMLQYHIAATQRRRPGQLLDPAAQAAEARAFLGFMCVATENKHSNYSDILKKEAELVLGNRDAYLYHEYLEAANEPIYFHEFVERLAAKKLQWVGEPTYSSPFKSSGGVAAQKLEELAGDRLELEQYLDFAQNRAFRRSVLCHANQSVRPKPDAATVKGLYAAAVLSPEKAEPDLTAGVVEKFVAANEPTLSTADTTAKAALTLLARDWPRAVAFDDLWRRTINLTGGGGADDAGRRHLAQTLLRCYQSGVVELHLYPPAFAAKPGRRPRAGLLARLQAADGALVVNRCHSVAGDLSDFDLLVLQQLDGTRDRDGILDALIGGGAINLATPDGTPVRDPQVIRGAIAPQLEPALERLANVALLAE